MKHTRVLALVGLTCLLASCGNGAACSEESDPTFDLEETSYAESSEIADGETRDIKASDYNFDHGAFQYSVQFTAQFPHVERRRIPWKINMNLKLYTAEGLLVYDETSHQKWVEMNKQEGTGGVWLFFAEYWCGLTCLRYKVKSYHFEVTGKIYVE